MSRLWLDILISLVLYLLAWACWELAAVLHMAAHFKVMLWELGYYSLNLLDTAPTAFNLLGLGLLLVASYILYRLFKSARGLFDRLLLTGKQKPG